MPDKDEWRTIHQVVPLNLYDRWMEQIRRVGRVNGIAVEAFDLDDKFVSTVGPRVMTYESLLILLERSDDAALRV